ncbi:hypothetical protein M0812_02809 [Anaeramoeba flamelloides]|uniref:Mitochondrial intermembrane space import and assembly protein 40 n=1 Tax=Anaeramoeba flamelloides TaxID=1746091 RepID=A0AAV7YTW4_9EUKA|nr:hypothetical protein M0812_02809 [Anaeramoeba flamelloides]
MSFLWNWMFNKKPEPVKKLRLEDIDWDCPCMKPVKEGPCGKKFMSAFKCYVGSKSDPKGSDCIKVFREFKECLQKHPEALEDDELSDNN